MRRAWIILAAVMGILAPAVAPAMAQTIKIGAAVALTGRFSKEGKLVHDGFKIWLEEVNKRGINVGGQRMKVDLILNDDESEPQTAVKLTEKLITQDKVQFILGPFSSPITQQTSVIGEKYKIITIAPQANSDPIYERGFGVGAITIAAIQATRHMHLYGTTEEDMALVSVRNHENALNNPYAHLRVKFSVEDALASAVLSWPMHLSDCCPSSDGACAIVFASEEQARKLAKRPAWVRGAGQITDNYFAGDRPWYEDWDSLAMLARRVYRLAKIDDPMREIDVAELYNAFSVQEILEYEALGFCEKGKGPELVRQGVTAMDGQLPVCPSGGVLSTNPIGASGLIRVAEAALQVMGKADRRQVPDVSTALAHAWGATIGFHTLMILDAKPP